METPPPAPTLTLGPVKPGKVEFEIEWTNPKGETGKGDPFEVTVVQLMFTRPGRCIGFDDTSSAAHPVVPAISVCGGGKKVGRIEILPRGTSVPTQLKPKEGGAFTVDPQSFSTFPQQITLTGNHKGNSYLTAAIEIEEGKTQTAAEMLVDVLREQSLEVLPVVLKGTPSFAPPVGAMISEANRDFDQACVTIRALSSKEVEPEEVPGYEEGETLIYNSEGWERLKSYANSHLREGQELTIFFVPNIATRVEGAAGRSRLEIDPLDFQTGSFIFVKPALGGGHLLGHEIGHYLFSGMYTSLEGAAHTDDADMLMYYYTGSGCEIRQKEWRRIQ